MKQIIFAPRKVVLDTLTVADLHSKILDVRPPWGSKFFQFHAVFGKFWQNRMLAPPQRVGALSSGKSWIRHCRLMCSKQITNWHWIHMDTLSTNPQCQKLLVWQWLGNRSKKVHQENIFLHLCANLWLKIQNTNWCRFLFNKFEIRKIST